MKKYSVERKDVNFAICEDDDGGQIKIAVSELPQNIREGDIIAQTENGYVIDREETAVRRKKMSALQKSVFGKNK